MDTNLDEIFFSLDEGRFQQFTELLDVPVAPNAGLERLLALVPPWATGSD